MTSSYDPINEALNTTSSIEISNVENTGSLRKKDTLTDDIDKDYEYTRAN